MIAIGAVLKVSNNYMIGKVYKIVRYATNEKKILFFFQFNDTISIWC